MLIGGLIGYWASCLLSMFPVLMWLNNKIDKLYEDVPYFQEKDTENFLAERKLRISKWIFWRKVKAIYLLTFPISCLLNIPLMLIYGIWTILQIIPLTVNGIKGQIDILRIPR